MAFDGSRQLRDARLQIAKLIHLRDGQIEIVTRSMRQRWRIVEHDGTAVGVDADLLALGALRQQIACGLESLNVVIGRSDVDDIFGATLGHVAIDADVRARMLA